jgi:SAM-dependent methyltransferase
VLLEEAKWLSRNLAGLEASQLYPMCNLGSSTEHYRRVVQPYIDTYLFEPARAKNLKVIHVDARPDEGVDMVGDLSDPSFLTRLSRLNVRSVMCCNLLEHVTNRVDVSKAVLAALKPGGYLIATVPYRFPYHEDPIDTMYRPSVKELAGLFPGTSVCKAAIVRASRFGYDMNRNYHALYRMIARAALPIYKPRRWWPSVQKLSEIAAGYKVTCVVLRKQN